MIEGYEKLFESLLVPPYLEADRLSQRSRLRDRTGKLNGKIAAALHTKIDKRKPEHGPDILELHRNLTFDES